jgi:hypothetical protein
MARLLPIPSLAKRIPHRVSTSAAFFSPWRLKLIRDEHYGTEENHGTQVESIDEARFVVLDQRLAQ